MLHFENHTKALNNCDGVIEEFKKYPELENYEKNSLRDIFQNILKNKIGQAIKNSKHVLNQMEEVENDDPSTKMHILIEDLLKESKKT